MQRALLAAAILILIPNLFSCKKNAERTQEAAALYESAYQKMILGNYDGAISEYKQSISLDKKFAQSWSGLSFCLLEKGEWKDAARAAENAAKNYLAAYEYDDKERFRQDALVESGEAYLMLGKEKKARQRFKAAFAESGKGEDVLLNIFVTCVRREKYSAAETFLEQAILDEKKQSAGSAILTPLYLYYSQSVFALGRAQDAFHALQEAKLNSIKAGGTKYDSAIDDFFARVEEAGF